MSLYGPGLTSTPKDRVKKAYPGAIAAQDARGWCIRIAASKEVGRGANASRAWEDAAKKLPR